MLTNYLIRNEDKTAYRIIDDESILVNVKQSTFHTLNPVATFIWKSLDGKSKVSEIIMNISQEFDIDHETAEKDCLEFINELLKENLVIKL